MPEPGEDTPEIRTGVVDWFNERSGFGFIKDAASGLDVFVHYSEIQREGFQTLGVGEKVRFGLVRKEQGGKAVNVEVIGPPDPKA